MHDRFKTLRTLRSHPRCHYYSLAALEEQGIAPISSLPLSIRVMLESLLRTSAGEEELLSLGKWRGSGRNQAEVPFVVSRVLLQDFTGVPLLVDLAAMRDAAAVKGIPPAKIEPIVPVDLVIDHSVQVDRAGTPDAFSFNLELEFARNIERYTFLKWGEKAFQTFRVIPPGIGIVHQVNLEYLASVVMEKKIAGGTLLYPDTLVGTDSHTTMINGLGIVGWGVGGIEAQAAMLGQPMILPTPEVIGVHFKGKLAEGVTATDLALKVTELLRKANVVDKFVEFFGEGVSYLSVADRATIANMAPEYGATMGLFPIDEKTLEYLKLTGREEEALAKIYSYLCAQKLFGVPKKGEIEYSQLLELDLSSLSPSVAGPKRPQDRIELSALKGRFETLLSTSIKEGGYEKPLSQPAPKIYLHSSGGFSPHIPHASGGKNGDFSKGEKEAGWSESEMLTNRPFTEPLVGPGYAGGAHCEGFLTHGSIVIAAITSCTNTSNPMVMIAAGLLAKKAVERGLKVSPLIKTSLAPGSRVVTDYLTRAGLQPYLDVLGFQLVAYGCTTCIGNSGPLDEGIERVIQENDLIVASVLSGNRNFEARIHSSVKANFLMSPPLVVAFAIAGKINIDLEKEPLGYDKKGVPVFLKEISPSREEIEHLMEKSLHSTLFKERYGHIFQGNPLWDHIEIPEGEQYLWNNKSSYIQKPPYFASFSPEPQPISTTLQNMRCLALFGDSVTTDHISPAGAFHEGSPAGKYLLSLGIEEKEFNSYGSRRGNHHVMIRGTFANVRIKNKMAQGKEGGYTRIFPEGTLLSIFEASQIYAERKTPLILFAGRDYGMGSSRDWAAKGSALLGVKAIVARSFERIHRSNLIGMGVLPLEFKEGESHETLHLEGNELFSLALPSSLTPREEILLHIGYGTSKKQVSLILRLDTPMEIEYYQQGGIMPYVLRRFIEEEKSSQSRK